MKTQKLYRPVGLRELEKILATNAKEFPPRLSWQPIFYPVLNEEYAVQISKEWNMPSEPNYCGFVSEFELPKKYLEKYEVQIVGGAIHEELWIPAEELADFNCQIMGNIQIIRAFYGEKYEGIIERTETFVGMNAKAQMAEIEKISDLPKLIEKEPIAIQANFAYWRQFADYQLITDKIKQVWEKKFPKRKLID